MWQDWVIAIVQWVFALVLIPAIRHPLNKPPFSSSLLTAILLTVLSFVFYTLSLWNSTFSSLAVAAAWYVLAWQKFRMDRSQKSVQAD